MLPEPSDIAVELAKAQSEIRRLRCAVQSCLDIIDLYSESSFSVGVINKILTAVLKPFGDRPKPCEHTYETLPDGSKICFECDHRVPPP